MGFPSPATDYAESTLTVSYLCGINGNSVVIETSSGYAVIERAWSHVRVTPFWRRLTEEAILLSAQERR